MSNSKAPRTIAAGAIGNALEWYDFAIYGYFAATIGRVFFPHEDKVAQVLAAFGIFAVGFLMRPVGGALIGYIGDRFGRRTALTFSVVAMAIPTFLVGVSVGGEYTTSIVFMVEQARPDRRGLIGATAGCGAVGGILAGSATGAVLAEAMSAEVLEAWGWRIPFLIGLLVGLAGFALRRGIHEDAIHKKAERSPLRDTLRHHGPLLLRLAALSVFNSVGFYLMFVYIVSWLQLADGIAPARALEINTVSMAILLPVMVAMGWLSDRIGRRPILLGATALGLIAAWPLFWLMHQADPAFVLLGQLGFVLAVGAFVGTQPTIMVEAVPASVRCTTIALGYNVTLGVVGGLSPLVATWLVERTANDYSPAFMIMAAAAISFLALLTFKETFRAPL